MSRTAEITTSGPERTSGAATRIKIIEAAEHLFGEYSIDATPLRAVSAAAGQKNTNSVQYHFKDRFGLLTAIFEYREAQLDILRGDMLARGKQQDKLDDCRYLMRVLFEPNFRHYKFNSGIDYIKLHATYLAHVRPRGVPHPVDYPSPATIHYRDGIARLRAKLSFLDSDEFDMRLAAVGAMFLSALVQHHVAQAERRRKAWDLFEHLIEMMVGAITVPPWRFSLPDRD